MSKAKAKPVHPRRSLTAKEKVDVLAQAIAWVRESERIAITTIATRAQHASVRPAPSADPFAQFEHTIQNYYFVMATKQMSRSMELLERDGDVDVRKLRLAFLAALPNINTLRNMIEHGDEYLVGEGRDMGQYEKALPAFPPQLGPNLIKAAAGASVSIIHRNADGTVVDAKVFIGGHVELGAARDALASVRVGLEKLYSERTSPASAT